MNLTKPDALAGYHAALTGAVVHRVPEPGTLRIAGPDRAAFIQRQTTNDIAALTGDRAPLTVLTSPTARILDVWRLTLEAEAVGVTTLSGKGATTAQYLSKRVFFMDKVTVTDASAEVAQFEVFGPAAESVLAEAGVAVLPTAGQVVAGEIGGVAMRLVGQEDLTGRGVLLLVPAAGADAVVAQLEAAGAAVLDAAAYAVLRVEAGLPAAGHELTEDFTPLEAKLDRAISSTKGCYTGQEVIARQITYDKITRRLAGVRLTGPADPGAAVEVAGRGIGVVTSMAESPRLGWLALAVIKRPHHAPGTAVTIRQDETAVSGTVAALPFAE